MRSRTDTLLVALAVLFSAALAGCAPEAPAEPEGSEAEVRASFDDLISAFEAQDVGAVLQLFTADAVAIDPPAPPGKFEGTEGIRAWAGGAFEAFDRIDIETQDVRVRTEGSVAWLTADYRFEARAEAMPEPYVAEGYVTTLWVRDEDGTYRSPLFHASPFPPPAE